MIWRLGLAVWNKAYFKLELEPITRWNWTSWLDQKNCRLFQTNLILIHTLLLYSPWTGNIFSDKKLVWNKLQFFWLEHSVKLGRFQSAPHQWGNFFDWMDWYNFASWVCQSAIHHLPLIGNRVYRLNGKCTLSHFCIEICKYHFFLPNYLVVPVQIHTSKICPVVQGTFICQFLFSWELFPLGISTENYLPRAFPLRIICPGLFHWELFPPGFCTVTGNFRIVSGNNLLLSQFAFHSFVSFVCLIFISPILPCFNV